MSQYLSADKQLTNNKMHNKCDLVVNLIEEFENTVYFNNVIRESLLNCAYDDWLLCNLILDNLADTQLSAKWFLDKYVDAFKNDVEVEVEEDKISSVRRIVSFFEKSIKPKKATSHDMQDANKMYKENRIHEDELKLLNNNNRSDDVDLSNKKRRFLKKPIKKLLLDATKSTFTRNKKWKSLNDVNRRSNFYDTRNAYISNQILARQHSLKVFENEETEFETEFIESQNVNVEHTRTSQNHIVQELIDTEESYIESLQYIVDKYIIGLASNKKILDELGERFISLFTLLPKIIKESKEFLKDLKQCKLEDYNEIGVIFLKHKTLFNRYPEYCKNKSVSLTERFQKNIMIMEKVWKDREGLNSRLLYPVQRIVRYELLLDTLLKRLIKDNQPRSGILDAIQFIKNVSKSSNTFAALGSIATERKLLPFKIEETGSYISSYTFTATKTEEIVCIFIFEKMVILTEENKKILANYFYKDAMNVESIEVDDTQVEDKTEFKLISYQNKYMFPYYLKSYDVKSKERFINDLESNIVGIKVLRPQKISTESNEIYENKQKPN